MPSPQRLVHRAQRGQRGTSRAAPPTPTLLGHHDNTRQATRKQLDHRLRHRHGRFACDDDLWLGIRPPVSPRESHDVRDQWHRAGAGHPDRLCTQDQMADRLWPAAD